MARRLPSPITYCSNEPPTPDARRPVDGKKGVSAQFITATGTGCNTGRKVAAGYLPGGKRPAGWKYKNKAGKVTATKKQAKVTFTLAD